MDEGILVSLRMMADHMPDYLMATLQRMAEEHSGSPPSQGPLEAPAVQKAL